MSKEITSTVEPSTELLGMLKADHDKVKELFEQFEQTADEEERAAIVGSAMKELAIHAELEEKIIYPAFRDHLEETGLIMEALEEHHVVHLLIKELKGTRVKPERRDAKFRVLTENVKHHIREEEECLFEKVQALDIDWEALHAKVETKKAKLTSQPRSSKGRH